MIPWVTIMYTNTTIMQKQCTHESYSDLFAVIKLTAEGYSVAATASKWQWQNEREELEGQNGTYWLIHTFILSAFPNCWLKKVFPCPSRLQFRHINNTGQYGFWLMKAVQHGIEKAYFVIERIWNNLLNKGSFLLQLKLLICVNGNTFGLTICG